MSDSERMVPVSQAIRMLTTGFEWEAGLFVEVYRELCKRLSREDAKRILGRAMYHAGIKLGEEIRALVDGEDTFSMAKAWDILYGIGTKEAETLDKERFVIRGRGCAAFNLFKRWGMSEEEIRFLADAYCAGDVGQAEGFSKRMHFHHSHRLMSGDEFCEWVYSMVPLQPAKEAVPKTDLEE